MTYRRIRIARIGSNQVVRFAVAELAKYLKQMDPDLMVDLLTTSTYNPASQGVLWVGLGLPVELPAVTDPVLDDAIVVSVQNCTGFISGTNERSILLAVYRFLQELGCTWTGPGKEGERIPARPVEKLCVILREAASFRHRGICLEGVTSFENISELIEFLPKVGMNSYFFQHRIPQSYMEYWYHHMFNPLYQPEPLTKDDIIMMNNVIEEEMALRGLVDQRCGHGWTCYPYGLDPMDPMPPFEEMSQEYKEDLALIDGERKLFANAPVYSSLCYSRKSVRDKVADQVIAYCKTHPNVGTVHFWLADMANNQCECEDCQKMSASDWYVVMLNELDEKLTAEHIDARIVFLLYNDLLWAPTEETIRNPDRFILMFAPFSREYGKSYGEFLDFEGELPPYQRNRLEMPKSIGENIAHLRNWQKFFPGDSFIFDYYLMWAHTGDLGYEKVARNIYEDIQYLKPLGINGMVNVQLQRAAFPTNLPLYIMGKALWNSACDYEAEVTRFYEAAFGVDGSQVHAYLNEISHLGYLWDQTYNGAETPTYGPFFQDYPRLRTLLNTFAPVIEANIARGGVCAANWQLLKLHNRYVHMCLNAAQLAEEKKTDEANAAFEQIRDYVRRNENALRKTYDTFLNIGSLKPKLHLTEKKKDAPQ